MDRDLRCSIAAFACLSLGGLLLHLRIHPPAESAFNLIPAAFGALNLLVLPVLLAVPRLAPAGFLLTCATAVVGTAGMAWYSAATWMGPVSLSGLVLRTTFPDIVILLAKPLLAWAILERQRPRIPRPAGCPEGAAS